MLTRSHLDFFGFTVKGRRLVLTREISQEWGLHREPRERETEREKEKKKKLFPQYRKKTKLETVAMRRTVVNRANEQTRGWLVILIPRKCAAKQQKRKETVSNLNISRECWFEISRRKIYRNWLRFMLGVFCKCSFMECAYF